MIAPNTDTMAVQRTRMRALIIPREHGAWGLLLVPLLTGMAAGITSADQIWPSLMFSVAALSLFWLRTPVQSLLGTGSLRASTSREWQTSLLLSLFLVAASAACLMELMWNGRNRELLVMGVIAALAFAAQSVFRKFGRRLRMAAQLVGAIGLTCTAPASYYISSGHLDRRAIILWTATWVFAGNQIHFVQLRIHSAHAVGFPEKFSQGKAFFLAQPLLLAILVFGSFRRFIPPLVIIAFIPVLARGMRWFFQAPEKLDIKSVGWSEMKQGAIFGVLLAIAFILS